MKRRTQLWVLAFMAGCLLLAGLLLAGPADARRGRVPPDVFRAVRAYWKAPAERIKAFDVISCETGGRYNTTAVNGEYLGMFQTGAWFRARYGFGSSARAQARAAHAGWVELGWGQWECA